MYILSSPDSRACTNCGTCVSKCTKSAIVLGDDNKYHINTNCDDCGDCKSACTKGSIVNNKIACWQDIIDLGATYPASVVSQSLHQYCPTKTEVISGSDVEISYPETYKADQLIMLGDLTSALGFYMDIAVHGSYNSGKGSVEVVYYADYTGGWGVWGADVDDPEAQQNSNTYQYITGPITVSDYYLTIQVRYLTEGASAITTATKTIKIDSSILYNNTSGSIPYHQSASFYVANKIQSILGSNLRVLKISDAYGNEITNTYDLPKVTDANRSYKFKKLLNGYNQFGAPWEYYSIQYISTYCVTKSVSSSYRKLGNIYFRVRSFPDNYTGSLENTTGISVTTGTFSSNRVSQKSSTLYPRIGVGHKESNYSTWFVIDASATYKGKLQIYVSLTRLTSASAINTFRNTYSPVAEFDYSNPGSAMTGGSYVTSSGFSSAWYSDFYGYNVWKTLNEQGAFENPTNIPKVQLLLVYS